MKNYWHAKIYSLSMNKKDFIFALPTGIPQGLPISATLANLYLLAFDVKILNAVVNTCNAYYRRYSDDIIAVCSERDADFIEAFITSGIQESKAEISENKTERFIFKPIVFGNKEPRFTSVKVVNGREVIGAPLNYLGFEFNGQKILVKSTNLAKFYRRMIHSVKSKAKRAKKSGNQLPGVKPALFRRQLYKLYTTRPLMNVKVRTNLKRLEKNNFGSYTLKVVKKEKILRGNYLSYIDRASEIMGEPAIKNQIKKHRAIFNEALRRHLKR
ncbi:MAG: hypothetical protein EOO07_33770 [Chitinophagaceae bacterium]|nr:MAG: hypothetical protein EOO07_33770 [Chitinophagaceae bacterium]